MNSVNSVLSRINLIIPIVLVCALTAWGPIGPAGEAWAQAFGSLKTVAVPEPPTLSAYIKDKNAAIQLGKALFWDMQLGSDGIIACASCHFHAGADSRSRNQINPGGDKAFHSKGPNSNLNMADFPFHKLSNPMNSASPLARPDSNDIAGSQGVVLKKFVDIQPGSAEEIGTPLNDPVFTSGGQNVRRVTGRNSPSVINAAFTFSNFWDGRANNVFNGANPFGAMDPNARILDNSSGTLTPVVIRIRNASLASQAVGPPLSDVEMSWKGRTWPKIGKKMLSLKPLAKQVVHPQDTVLGPFSNARGEDPRVTPGINTTYQALIRAAFRDRYWNDVKSMVVFGPNGNFRVAPRPAAPLNTNQFTQMEANFSLFFGLAIQMYESTLIADNSPFDRFMEGSGAQTVQEADGMGTFNGGGGCKACHFGPEFTANAVNNVIGRAPTPAAFNQNPLAAIEFMAMLDGQAFYDVGYYNIGTRPIKEDVGRGGLSPFKNPITNQNFPLAFSRLAMQKISGNLPAAVAEFTPNLPVGFLPGDTTPTPGRINVRGAFKTPALRNVELTGPYMHNGGMATLRQVVDFYTRGSDFPIENRHELNPAITIIGRMQENAARRRNMVAFLLSLTDERVKNESAPFDHPELLIPNGVNAQGDDIMLRLPEVGFFGRPAEGVLPLQPFLNASPTVP